jgi:hypothetical protein
VADYQLSYDDHLGTGRTAQDLWACGLDYTNVDEERLARILDRLPPKQADLIELTRQGVPQSAMAAIFGSSQASISILLKRAILAVRALLSLPDISEESLVRDLTRHLEPETVELLRVYFVTGSYAWTAERLQCVSHNEVRRRIIRTVRLLHDIPDATDYHAFFAYMLDNPTPWAHTNSGRSTREVQREREAPALSPA